MTVLRLSLNGLGVALLMGGFWGIGWGAVTGGCVECGLASGVIVAALSLAFFWSAYVLLARTSRGRLLIATGKVQLHQGRMLVLASATGLMYGISAFLNNGSVPLAVVAAGAMGLGAFVVVPIVLWRLLRPELDLAD